MHTLKPAARVAVRSLFGDRSGARRAVLLAPAVRAIIVRPSIADAIPEPLPLITHGSDS